jgi:diguanylate cyclase (GGDEF)-like protein
MQRIRGPWKVWLPPLVVLALGVGAGAVITSLYARADQSRKAQVEVGSLRVALGHLQDGALSADPAFGAPAFFARQKLVTAKAEVREHLRYLTERGSSAHLNGLAPAIEGLYPTVDAMFAIGSSPGGFSGSLERTSAATSRIVLAKAAILDQLNHVTDDYARSASRMRTKATVGSAVTLFMLLGAFLFFYQRSARARRRADEDAMTDALTGLRNRRALDQDFPRVLARQRDDGTEIMLAMFDLDGFKQYNDTFGHGAGDALLRSLGEQLTAAVGNAASCYRTGGDEFCIVAAASAAGAAGVVNVAAEALSIVGETWSIGCSYGVVWAPSEAPGLTEALSVADQRMYANKASRAPARSERSAHELLGQACVKEPTHSGSL